MNRLEKTTKDFSLDVLVEFSIKRLPPVIINYPPGIVDNHTWDKKSFTYSTFPDKLYDIKSIGF
ncbi:MAG: hypothetical protein DRH34_07800 [Deltaproteobacteria bacterium]|nr:MAG: hypothetical protein DRH34_07800 [Deltaproteobacteria bacterium]RLC22819.1 MAG: hypothetical protein DRH93_08910 [Deltaproteobacteria bacterium]